MTATDHLLGQTGHTFDLLNALSDTQLSEQREYWKEAKTVAIRESRWRDEHMISRQLGHIDLIESRRAKNHENDSPS